MALTNVAKKCVSERENGANAEWKIHRHRAHVHPKCPGEIRAAPESKNFPNAIRSEFRLMTARMSNYVAARFAPGEI